MFSAIPAVGVLPCVTTDPVRARDLLWRDGAAILSGVATDEATANGLAATILGDQIRQAAGAVAVRERGGVDQKNVGSAAMTPLHTDGFAAGVLQPDVFLLVCAVGAPGGESFLVDEVALMAALADGDDEDRALASFAHDRVLDQTEDGGPPVHSPLAVATPSGRLMVRRPFDIHAMPDDPDPGLTARLAAQWAALHDLLGTLAPRFTLEPGDAIIIDNYRLTHGRDAYFDPERLLWRCWAWTDTAVGVPEHVRTSDTRDVVAGAALEAAGRPAGQV